MKMILIVAALILISGLIGCGQQTYKPQPEVPGLQQYYQMPGPYYTAPPPKLQYHDPGQDQNK